VIPLQHISIICPSKKVVISIKYEVSRNYYKSSLHLSSISVDNLYKKYLGGELNVDYERYYLDLLDMMNSSFKKIASGKYDKKDVERLFELSKTGRYPQIFTEMAESFSMMMIKVEARDFHLKQLNSELEETKI